MATSFQVWAMRETDFIKQNSTQRRAPFILGVTGGSGSGKTYFASELLRNLSDGTASILYQDNFYFDQSAHFDFDGGSVNFDHPSSIDFQLLAECIQQLKAGRIAQIPSYDFVTHSRSRKTEALKPNPLVIVDGILIAHAEPVRQLCDAILFFDTAEEIRYQRRLNRDVQERGRTPEGVRNQFLKQVKPMHDQFVEPSKAWATRIVNEGLAYQEALREFSEKFGK